MFFINSIYTIDKNSINISKTRILMKKNDFNFMLESQGISNENLLEIALETGFIKRQRLITPLDFLSAVCSEAACGIASYNDIAANIDAEGGPCVSKQAIYNKVKPACEDFLKKTLALIIKKKLVMMYLKQ